MSVFSTLSLPLPKKNSPLPVAYMAARRNRLRVDQIPRRPITRVRLCTIIVIIIMYTCGREDRGKKTYRHINLLLLYVARERSYVLLY